MGLDDVWKTIDTSLGAFWKGRFDQIPQAPGIYAWFYPLRVSSLDFDTFLAETRAVHLYEAREQSTPRAAGTSRLGWSELRFGVELANPAVAPHPNIRAVWD